MRPLEHALPRCDGFLGESGHAPERVFIRGIGENVACVRVEPSNSAGSSVAIGRLAAVAVAVASVDARRRDLMTKWWTIRGETRRTFVKEQFDLTTDDLRPQDRFAPVKAALCAARSETVSDARRLTLRSALVPGYDFMTLS
jgi:hypothetical protein